MFGKMCSSYTGATMHIFDNDTSDNIQSLRTVQDRCGQCTELSPVCIFVEQRIENASVIC